MVAPAKRVNVVGWKRLAVCAAAMLLSGVCASLSRAQDRAVAYAPADIRYGAQIYAAQCSACHGFHQPGQAPATGQDRLFTALGLPAGQKPRGLPTF